MKRILSLYLCVCCMFFTGCNSILYNGNFHIKAYEPETLAGLEDFVSGSVKDAEDASMEKYDIEGTDAFFILPGHDNNPGNILDFKVLDYTSDNRFIYAYMTPWLGEDEPDSGLLGSIKATGNRKNLRGLEEFWKKAAEEKEEEAAAAKATESELSLEEEMENVKPAAPGKYAVVLMSYEPDTGEYMIFFSRLGNLPTGDEELSVSTHKLGDKEEYFIFYDQAGYLFDKSGRQITYSDAVTLISQEKTLIQRNRAKGQELEVIISDVVMDQNYYMYIPLMFQIVSEDSEVKEDTQEDDLEETVFSVMLVCYGLDIGGRDASIVFYSDNTAWEKQAEVWKEKDGYTFSSKAEFEAYQKNASIERIKAGAYGGCRDNYEVFQTKYLSNNMKLAGFPDLENVKFYLSDNSGLAKTNLLNEYGEYKKGEKYKFFRQLGEKYCQAQGITFGYQAKKIENVSDFAAAILEREQWVIKTALVLSSHSFQYYKPFWRPLYIKIPEICPGVYDVNQKTNPWNLNGMTDEHLFARLGTAAGTDSEYAIIWTEGRYTQTGDKKSFQPVMELCGEPDVLERTLCYKEKIKTTNEDGEEEEKEIIHEVTETIEVYNHYRVVMPDNTKVFWAKVLNKDDMAALGNGWGVVYYNEQAKQSAFSDDLSKIEYNDGKSLLLRDSDVPGKAQDARILYCGNEQLLVFVTSTGVKLYPWDTEAKRFYVSGADGNSDANKPKYVSFEEFLRVGDYTLDTAAIEELEEYPLTEEQSQSINRSLNKSGNSESYSSAAFTLTGNQQLLISSLENGLIHYSMGSGMSFSILNGAYYSTFRKGKTESHQYVVVGYQTDEYSYAPRDLPRAKKYEFSLDGKEKEIYVNAVENYLEDKIVTVKANRYEAEENKTAAQKTADALVESLFYSETETDTANVLAAVLESLGISNEAAKSELLDYALKRRRQLVGQRHGQVEFYKLAGVMRRSDTDDEKLFQALEESLMRAYYPSDIEKKLVSVRLFETCVNDMGSAEDKVRYRGYQKEYAAYLSNQTNANQGFQTGSGTANSVQLDEDGLRTLMLADFESRDADGSKTGALREGFEKMGFYTEILDELKERYEASGNGTPKEDWDTCIRRLLFLLTEEKRTGLEVETPELTTDTEETSSAAEAPQTSVGEPLQEAPQTSVGEPPQEKEVWE